MNDTTIIRRQSLNQLRSAVSELNQTLLQKEEVIEEQTRKLVSLEAENEKLASEIEFYREQIQLAKHRQFAKSSEKRAQRMGLSYRLLSRWPFAH